MIIESRRTDMIRNWHEKEALQARQTHTHRSGQKESGHRQTTSRVNKRPSTHSSATSRRKQITKKIPDISRYDVRK